MPDSELLNNTISALSEPVYAVLDGSYLDDISDRISAFGETPRSLFLDRSDPQMRKDGPWLLPVGDEGIRMLLVELALQSPCLVFWSFRGDEEAIWRHLRSINQVFVPIHYAGMEAQNNNEIHERVLFRHWDPNVLASVMPILDADQFSRTLGSAEMLLLHSPEHGGLKRVLNPAPRTVSISEPLRFTAAQMAQLANTRMERSRSKVAAYIREMDPDTQDLSDAEMRRAVLEYEACGSELGLRSERAHMKWAYLMSITDGGAARNGVAKEFFARSRRHPDDAIDDVLDGLDDRWRAR